MAEGALSPLIPILPGSGDLTISIGHLVLPFTGSISIAQHQVAGMAPNRYGVLGVLNLGNRAL